MYLPYLLSRRRQPDRHLIQALEDDLRVDRDLFAVDKLGEDLVPALLRAVVLAAEHVRRKAELEERLAVRG